MLQTGYSIELDIYSGQQNPYFIITKEDFENFFSDIDLMDSAPHGLFFEGLGFRGLILSGQDKLSIYIQNKIIKLERKKGIIFLKSNRAILYRALNLFKKYDTKGEHELLLKRVIEKYL